MEKIKLAYFGSPDFAADFLEKLVTDPSMYRYIEVKLVITQPDQLVGRKQVLTATPVKTIAEKYKIKSKILNHKSQINNKSQIQNSKRLEFGTSNLFGAYNLEFSALKNINLALVYAFGEIIPKELLNLSKYGFWNIHPSLLPKYRGSSPIASPLINGDKTTGVTIIKMDEEIDHGPIIIQESLMIENDDKRPDLEKKLTNLAFEMFKDVIKKIYGQDDILSLQKTAQDHILATYTKKLTKQDGFVEFKNLKLKIENSSGDLYNLFRGLYPWPGLWTILPNGKRLKIAELNMVQNRHACSLRIKRVQLEGKKEVDFETFNSAYKIF